MQNHANNLMSLPKMIFKKEKIHFYVITYLLIN